MPHLLARLDLVKEMRLKSTKKSTNAWADYPSLFAEERQPESDYILIPRVSSERRKYIPIGFLNEENIVSDSAIALPNADLFTFGIITSEMHMAWVKYTCGRLESRYRYSNTIVYNNYPWPLNPTDKQKKNIEEKAQAILDAREKFPDATLADLYDPLTMPPVLLKAHQALDKAVDSAYSKKSFKTEAQRVAFLFDLYQKYTSLLPTDEKKTKKKKSK